LAIELIRARDDLGCVILDLMMPNVDGRAVLAHIAASERRLPVIICTAVVPRYIPELDPGIVRAVVQKPFEIERILELVLPLVS
jgi:CheY-like chemotaxis protein